MEDNACCGNCGHIDPEDGPFCEFVEGPNYGHTSEVSSDYVCGNWIPQEDAEA